jgi:hypothetical protein
MGQSSSSPHQPGIGEGLAGRHHGDVPYEFEFDAKNLPGGVYFPGLQYGNKTETQKMILSR